MHNPSDWCRVVLRAGGRCHYLSGKWTFFQRCVCCIFCPNCVADSLALQSRGQSSPGLQGLRSLSVVISAGWSPGGCSISLCSQSTPGTLGLPCCSPCRAPSAPAAAAAAGPFHRQRALLLSSPRRLGHPGKEKQCWFGEKTWKAVFCGSHLVRRPLISSPVVPIYAVQK